MVSISRRPRTEKEFDEIIQEYWEKVIPMYRVKDTGALIEFDVTAWANSELEIFGYEGIKIPYGPEIPHGRGLLMTAKGESGITNIHLTLEPNRWVVIFRRGIEDTDRNEIFIFYVLDIESRKGGYQTIWVNPPRLLSEKFHSGKIFQDWGPRGWAANEDAEWAYLDVAKDTGGFINWPFENPLHRGGRA